MKKFFTNIPLQIAGDLDRFVYIPVGNSRLGMDKATSFPIIPAISGYVERGEEFRLIAVVPASEAGERNCVALETELETLCRDGGMVCPKGVERIPGPPNQKVASHVTTFQSLIDCVEDNDELFICITFGTKPMSMALLTAARYAYRLKRNASLSCIVYGEIDRIGGRENKANWKAYLYDETALAQMDEITRMLAELKIENPRETVRRILEL